MLAGSDHISRLTSNGSATSAKEGYSGMQVLWAVDIMSSLHAHRWLCLLTPCRWRCASLDE